MKVKIYEGVWFVAEPRVLWTVRDYFCIIWQPGNRVHCGSRMEAGWKRKRDHNRGICGLGHLCAHFNLNESWHTAIRVYRNPKRNQVSNLWLIIHDCFCFGESALDVNGGCQNVGNDWHCFRSQFAPCRESVLSTVCSVVIFVNLTGIYYYAEIPVATLLIWIADGF